jgi:hypothetical protein
LAIITRRSLDFEVSVEQEYVPHDEFTQLLDCDEV